MLILANDWLFNETVLFSWYDLGYNFIHKHTRTHTIMQQYTNRINKPDSIQCQIYSHTILLQYLITQ